MAGIKCQPMRLGEFDRSGRRRPEEGGDAVRHPGRPGAGGHRPDAWICRSSPTASPWRPATTTFVQVNPVTGQTSENWIFAGGDAVTGPSSVVEAVAAGERAAVGIDLYLDRQEPRLLAETREVDTPFDPDAEPVDTPREKLST